MNGVTMRNSLLLAFAACVAACGSVGPDYEAKPVPAPSAWSAERGQSLADAPHDGNAWWSEFGDPAIDALVDAALRVADDLCLLLAGPAGEPVLSAAVLCSPNRWRLSEKLGGTMAAIHGPVARYDTDLDSPVNAMLSRLSAGRPVWRVNWGLSNHPSLFQPEIPPATPAMDVADMWFRVEWQTLRRLPVTGGILFTIRTHTERLADFAARDRAVVHDFADLVAKIPENVAAYKSIAPYRERVFEWLSSR